MDGTDKWGEEMRAIDADALIARACQDSERLYLESVAKHTPSIDIVRCKECKHRKSSGYVGSIKTYECDITGFRMHDLTNHFCSYGEREGE